MTPTTPHAEGVRLCCVIKPRITWHTERLGSICRERCGGQGYLKSSRFSSTIGFAHAGITAEGDNSVLMQKVAKELLDAVRSNTANLSTIANRSKPNTWRLDSLDDLADFARLRSDLLIKELSQKMATKVGQGKTIFEVWMLQESDLIQATSRAYGERICVDQFMQVINKAKGSLKNILTDIAFVFFLDLIESNLGWFMINQVLQPSQGERIVQLNIEKIANLAPQALNIVEAFDIPQELLFAPIALDWERFNEYDNRGEVLNFRPKL
ncbi:hypothetical protein K7432_012129 [Basidiobolus ranarum]|uniref:Acyl-CoA oxidase n=1 Tax=Basidiobolus ranarum TaxID=34480 RepID=A0ABR2VSR6_9FUNG